MRDWKLRKRLILAFMIIVLLPILALSSFNVVFTRQTMERQVEDSFSDSIYQIS
jgi:Tfp pilus assembly protein PilX